MKKQYRDGLLSGRMGMGELVITGLSQNFEVVAFNLLSPFKEKNKHPGE